MTIFTTHTGELVRPLNRDDFCAALNGCLSSMPQIAKAEMYGVKDKIFGPSLATEVEPFDLLSFRSLKLTGSVGHSGNSLLHTLGRAAAFLETLDVMYMAIRPFTSYPAGKTSQPHLHCTYLSVLSLTSFVDLTRMQQAGRPYGSLSSSQVTFNVFRQISRLYSHSTRPASDFDF